MLIVSDFGTRGPGSIPGWALITNCVFFSSFSFFLLDCKILHTKHKDLYK